MADIRIKTLTPLWTGGVDGKADRIHETGLLGSMRWWYEAIVRGLGGTACDPGKGECQFDVEKFRRSAATTDDHQRLRDAGLCDVCQLFGATGWRRRFRITVATDQTTPLWQGDQPLNVRPPGRNRGWFLPPGRMGEFTLRLNGDGESIMRVLALLRFVERWGSLGAKPQLGYGAVEIQNWDEIEKPPKELWRQEAQRWARNRHGRDRNLPNLCDFGFFRYRFQPVSAAWWSRIGGFERVVTQMRPFATQTVPVAPALKNAWRFQHWQRAWGNDQLFWGRVAADRIRGKVAVSWAYPYDDGWEIRGSAWLTGVETEPVWQMLINAEIWNTTLGVSGTLETARPQTIDELLTFLERI